MPAQVNRNAITLYQFYAAAIRRYERPCRKGLETERYGQAMFNHLSIVRPDLAGKIRGTECDPFFIPDTTHPNWQRFVQFIESNWYSEVSPSEKKKASCDCCPNSTLCAWWPR